MNGTPNRQAIERIVERKADVRRSTPVRHGVERALGAVADRLSRRNLLLARCELCNEALHHLVDLCYERDERGHWVNVEPLSGMILIGMPCSWRSYQAYGLRRTEADVLRYALQHWQHTERYPLLAFLRHTTRWHLTTEHYVTPQAARGWLAEHPVTPALWDAATQR